MKGNETQVAAQGWWNTIKEKLQLDSITENFKSSKDTLIDIALYGGIGFLTGFLLKRFSLVIALCVAIVAILLILQQFDVVFITVNWVKVNEAFGIQPVSGGETLVTMMWEWIKANLIISTSLLIGFLLGIKIG